MRNSKHRGSLHLLNSESPVIRFVEYLGLSEDYQRIANELIEQSDMPIVFWLESEMDKNYRQRYLAQRNEYWVVVKPQEDENERVRLILGGIYTAVMEQRRYWVVTHNPEYKVKILATKNKKHIESFRELPNALNSIVGTLNVEWFLAQHGIGMRDELRQFYFRDRIRKLKDYKRKRHPPKGKASVKMFREIEIINLIEYGNYYRFGEPYQRELRKLLPQVEPHYLGTVERIAEIITDFQKAHTGDNGDYLSEKFLCTIIEELKFEDLVLMVVPEAYCGTYPVSSEEFAPVFSYIPKTIPQQTDIIRWTRYSRELVSTYRNSQKYFSSDVTINLIDTEIANSYADGNQEKGYCISFTVGLIRKMLPFVENWTISPAHHSILSIIGDSTFRRELLRQVVYLITAHEYAHILNGDCDQSSYRIQQQCRTEVEIEADRCADRILSSAARAFYRFPPAPKGEHKRMSAALKTGGIEAVMDSITPERQKEICMEVQHLKFKLYRDKQILEEAKLLLYQFRSIFG